LKKLDAVKDVHVILRKAFEDLLSKIDEYSINFMEFEKPEEMNEEQSHM